MSLTTSRSICENGSEVIALGDRVNAGWVGETGSFLVGEVVGEVVRESGVFGGAGKRYSSKNFRRTAGLQMSFDDQLGWVTMAGPKLTWVIPSPLQLDLRSPDDGDQC